MYCKQCGSQIDDNAKFCTSCGAPVEHQPQPDPEPQYTAPKPFETNSVDESQNYQYQQSTFKGKQYSTGTSGSIGFGSPRKKGGFGKLIKFGAIAVVVIIAIVIFSGLGGPITLVESGTGYDGSITDLTGKTRTFATTDDIYILFEHEDLEYGDRLFVSLFYEDEEYTDHSYYFDISEAVGWGYVRYQPSTTWATGEYTVEFTIGEELLETYNVTVE